jgi:hypothetical protein
VPHMHLDLDHPMPSTVRRKAPVPDEEPTQPTGIEVDCLFHRESLTWNASVPQVTTQEDNVSLGMFIVEQLTHRDALPRQEHHHRPSPGR